MTRCEGKDLRYRLRRKGYDVNIKDKVVILPPCGNKRSMKMEQRIQKEFNYTIQYRMYE